MAKKKSRKKAAASVASVNEAGCTNIAEHLTVINMSQIKQRDDDTRKLDLKHVQALQDSIIQMGLLQPIVVDQKNKLLAGGHRLAAIQKMKGDRPEDFVIKFPGELVPVRVISIARSTGIGALQVELAENEQRRDYTEDELKVIIQRLQEAGYSMAKGGKINDKNKHITRAISSLLGKSERQARRILRSMDRTVREEKPVEERMVARVEKVTREFLAFARSKNGADEFITMLADKLNMVEGVLRQRRLDVVEANRREDAA